MSSPATPSQLADAQAEFLRRLDQLQAENAELGKELLRCYEQLNLLFEITEKIATLHDPTAIVNMLYRRYAGLLNVSAAFAVRDDDVEPITAFDALAPQLEFAPQVVRAALDEAIVQARTAGRTIVVTPKPEAAAALAGAHVMCGLFRHGSEPVVLIALRAATEPAFDSSDMLAAESVLGYGGHILNNVLLGRELQKAALDTVKSLAAAIDAKDAYTSGHSERVGWLAQLVGAALELSELELQMLGWAGLLHDVGKIGVPEHILNKPGKLTDEEFDAIKKHPQIGYDVLKPVAHFGPVLDAVLYHHENHDGGGYPAGLAGNAIPLAARIVHVVDIFDALTTSRSYRKGFSVEKALRILNEDAGRVTDPEVTDTFIRAFNEYRKREPDDFATRFAHLDLSTAAEGEERP